MARIAGVDLPREKRIQRLRLPFQPAVDDALRVLSLLAARGER